MSFWAQWLRPSAGLPTVQWSLLLAVAAMAGYLIQRHTGLPKVLGGHFAIAGFELTKNGELVLYNLDVDRILQELEAGGLQGEVEYISPDTLEAGNGPNGQPQTHYRVRVATRVSTLQGPDGRPLPVLPGMTASIEIRTGERSVLEFLISPMLKGREAFRER
jgi:hypothetical protein